MRSTWDGFWFLPARSFDIVVEALRPMCIDVYSGIPSFSHPLVQSSIGLSYSFLQSSNSASRISPPEVNSVLEGVRWPGVDAIINYSIPGFYDSELGCDADSVEC